MQKKKHSWKWVCTNSGNTWSRENSGDEINVAVGSNEDSNSQASKFVDATKLNEDDNESSNNDSQQGIPQRIQNDMTFLHVSWANLADLDHEEINKQNLEKFEARREAKRVIDTALQREDAANIEVAGFQLVTNRKEKLESKYISSKKFILNQIPD